MSQFDESKVINALHPEKAEVGKKYWCSDVLQTLKKYVEDEDTYHVFTLDKVLTNSHPFQTNRTGLQFLYPYEEPPKKRMTYRQFAEWLMKGNGEYVEGDEYLYAHLEFAYSIKSADEELKDSVKIRTWDSDEWVEPTLDIYERDCKKRN